MSFVENALKGHLGLKTLKDYQKIDDRKWGNSTTTITEVASEEYDGNKYVRFRFTTYKGTGTTGTTRKNFAWPVSNLENPVEIKQILQMISDALVAGDSFADPRSGIGRLFDNLFGLNMVNYIEIANHQHFGKEHKLSARIYKHKNDDFVTLIHKVIKGQQIWIQLPNESVHIIKEWFDNLDDTNSL